MRVFVPLLVSSLLLVTACSSTDAPVAEAASVIVAGDSSIAETLGTVELGNEPAVSVPAGDYDVSVWQGCSKGDSLDCSMRIMDASATPVEEVYAGFAARAREQGWDLSGPACEKAPLGNSAADYESTRCKATSPGSDADVEIFWAFDQPSYQVRIAPAAVDSYLER